MSEFPKNIFLIGFMGTGKTSLGKKIALKIQRKFIDLDSYIETEMKMSIADLFKKYGENEFRIIERDSLSKLIENNQQIISCGGGTPLFKNNMELMLSNGCVVYIESSIGKLFHRLKRNRIKRPLIADLNDEELLVFIKTKLNERNIVYKKAHLIHNTDDSKEVLIENIQKLNIELFKL